MGFNTLPPEIRAHIVDLAVGECIIPSGLPYRKQEPTEKNLRNIRSVNRWTQSYINSLCDVTLVDGPGGLTGFNSKRDILKLVDLKLPRNPLVGDANPVTPETTRIRRVISIHDWPRGEYPDSGPDVIWTIESRFLFDNLSFYPTPTFKRTTLPNIEDLTLCYVGQTLGRWTVYETSAYPTGPEWYGFCYYEDTRRIKFASLDRRDVAQAIATGDDARINGIEFGKSHPSLVIRIWFIKREVDGPPKLTNNDCDWEEVKGSRPAPTEHEIRVMNLWKVVCRL